MAYESGHSSIHGVNNSNIPQKHSPNFIPEDSNVIRFISKFANNYTGMIKEEHWSSNLLNHVKNRHPTSIPVSHSSNRYNASMESTRLNRYGLQNSNQPQMWDFSSGFNNSGSSMNMVYNNYNPADINNSNIIHFGGSSINDVDSTNMLSDVMNLLSPSDVNQAIMEVDTYLASRIAPHGSVSSPPGSVLNFISSSSAANIHQGRSHRVHHSTRNPQRSNFGTYLKPQAQMPVLNQYNKRAHEVPIQSDNQSINHSDKFKIPRVNSWKPVQSEPQVQTPDLNQYNKRAYEVLMQSDNDQSINQSDKLKIPRLNSWKPVQSQPIVAEQNWRNNCYSLNCKSCTPAVKQLLGPTSDESWVGSGTLTEVLLSFMNRSDKGRISQESNDRQQPVTEPSIIDLDPEDNMIDNNQIIKPSEKNNIETKNEEMKDANDLSFEDFSAWLNQQHVPISLPDLEPCEDHLIENNQIIQENIDTMFNELKGLVEFQEINGEENKAQSTQVGPQLLECPEKNSEEIKAQTTQVGPELICEVNSPSDDYESVMDSIQPKTPIERESHENKKTTFDDYSVFGSSGEIKKTSASFYDYFSASQIKEHLSSFIKHDNNKESAIQSQPDDGQKPCQLCCMYKKPLARVPIYCSSCDLQVKQNAGYYRLLDENENVQHCFCKKCYSGSRKAITLIRGGSIPKANLSQAQNNEEGEDSVWVQCDRCKLWQHRICGLYNGERDEEGKAEYICPNCRLKEIENENVGQAVKTCLGAKDLPRTNLSDHIEQRLFRRMKQEREEAANFFGTTFENVAEAEGLVVRVIASVDKELEVKQQFRDIFQGQDYPEKLSYRSKLILLFQKIGGVDLCIFGIYVQEYGSECDGPNKRSVYISYLDSVKYFQPERKTASGEPLRTFVYHEILIGYLEHCKKRGFATCYIWSCPPNGNDYLFYCHPKDQKTPKENNLRQWYKSMLRKAGEDGIVVDQTNLYDEFFDSTNNGNDKITAAHLPYFDGNYWSPLAENISKKFDEDQERRGGLRDKLSSKRAKYNNPTKDARVMQDLGKEIMPMKENFIIVRLQHVCTCCNEVILSGSKWSCNHCNKIHLCSKCFDDGKQLSPTRMHTCPSGKNRLLSEDVLRGVPVDTKDIDDVIVNKFFADRDDFLDKCQKSKYQFDTIGHAKYSSLMILYHFTQSLVVHPITSST